MNKVAIVGASGFVGTVLVERMRAEGRYDIVPCIRSTGNAWGLVRLGMNLRLVDLLTGSGLDDALSGADYVVNCSRGGKDVMLDGLTNLIDAAKKHRVKHFVHISSVMIYGDPPQAVVEEAPLPRQSADSYGSIKLKQDEMVISAAQSGLPSTILVPPNISGPGSPYLLSILNAVESNRFALVDRGANPINLVDVQNLCHAIELAIANGRGDGSRYFITDDSDTTWADVLNGLEAVRVNAHAIPGISREELTRAHSATQKAKKSLLKGLRHLVSSDVRKALRKDPFWESIEFGIRRSVAMLGSRVEEKLRSAYQGPVPIQPRNDSPVFDVSLCSHQLRMGRHSLDKAARELGYVPEFSYQESIDRFVSWYRYAHGLDTEFGDMLTQLYD